MSPSTSRLRRASQTLAALGLCLGAAGLFGVPAIAQEPGQATTNLRQQNDKLRAELEALRAELKALRSNLNQAAEGARERSLLEDKDHITWRELRADLAKQGEAWDRYRRAEAAPVPQTELPTMTPDGTVVLPKGESPTDTQQVATALRAAIERRRQADATALGEPVPSAVQDPTQPAKAPAVDPTPSFAGFPVLRDVPLISRLFVDTNNDGLPDQAVQQDVAAPADRPTAGSSAEATADLATRCLDLQGEIELAEANASEIEQLAAAGRVSTVEARKATVNLNTLRRKQAIVQRLIRGEIEATQSELQWLEHQKWLENQKREPDKTSHLRLDMQVQRATTRLEVLRAVK